MTKRPKHKRLEPYIPPTSAALNRAMEDEAAAIARGETEGLDPTKVYLAVRAVKDKSLVWVIVESPYQPKSLEDSEYRVMFVANVTLATAVYLVKAGAEVRGGQDTA